MPAAFLTAILILSALCEVSKIPINPWSKIGGLFKKLLRLLGDAMNGDIQSQMDEITAHLKEIEDTRKVERKKNIRRSILRFSDECRVGTRHSKEMFINVLSDIDEYELLCRDTDDPNSVIEEAIEYIKELNHKCHKENSYL